MTLSIIIVNFNTKKLLKKCLDSIIRQKMPIEYEIIVIDNGSTDESPEYIKTYYPKVALIENEDNVGFAKANNQGVNKAQGKYVLLLNSDTVVGDQALTELVAEAEQDRARIASCMLLNPDGSVQPQGGDLPGFITLFSWSFFLDDLPLIGPLLPTYQRQNTAYFREDREMGWLGGTALLVRRKTYQRLHGLDEKIFMYAEDVDFCLRAKKQGIDRLYYPGPKITHLGQGSGSKENSIVGEYQGLLHLIGKHYPAWQQFLLKWILKSGAFLRMIIFGIILRSETKKSIYQKAFDLA